MRCRSCEKENSPEAPRCAQCGAALAVAILEVVRGNLPEKVHFLKPRPYTLGRARHNDLCLSEASISKVHAKIGYDDGHFSIEDLQSLHGVYVNTAKVQKLELRPGALIQLGNVTLKFSLLSSNGGSGSTQQLAEFPWVEQQQLLLSLVQTLNSTLVLSEVLEQVLDAVMRITRAERGFLLMADSSPEAARYQAVAGLRLRVGRQRGGGAPLSDVEGISTSVVRRALETGATVATGNAAADPMLGTAQSVILMDLRTIVCIPLRSPRAGSEPEGEPRALGALYVDNQETSAPFSADSLRAAEALARHAALAIENAQLFEREQDTIEELRLAQKQLLQSEKLAAIGQMAAGIAHELNTPLTYIVGNLELLQASPVGEAQQAMLGSISRGAERIRALAQGLLAFSRPSGEEPVPLELNEIVERSLELCHYQILKGGVRLEKRLASASPRVLGVANQLEMALINLIVNAVQAMGAGGRLTVASGRNGNDVEVLVGDTGPGIPPEIQPSIFEPFVSTKPEGHGTGLGLSTTLMVVERHRGRIDFTTGASGTTFRITLPAA
jgi:signal transduction histidine kinase